MKDQITLQEDMEDRIRYMKYLLSEIVKIDSEDKTSVMHICMLSVILRNLLIDRGKNQTSLTKLLDIQDKLFFDSKLTPISGLNNLASETKLCMRLFQEGKQFYVHKHETKKENYINFDTWLNEIVIDNKEAENNLVTRRDIILVIADKEAAHTDPKYDEVYEKIVKDNKMNIKFAFDDVELTPSNDLYKESLITIAKEFIDAYELFLSIKDEVLIKDDTKSHALLMVHPVKDERKGYRFQIWFDGSTSGGMAAKNRLNFENNTLIPIEYYSGHLVKLHIGYKKKKRIILLSFDYPNIPLTIKVDNDKYIFAAYYQSKKGYILLGGSQIGIQTSVKGNKHNLTPYYCLLKEDMFCRNYEDLNKALGIE